MSVEEPPQLEKLLTIWGSKNAKESLAEYTRAVENPPQLTLVQLKEALDMSIFYAPNAIHLQHKYTNLLHRLEFFGVINEKKEIQPLFIKSVLESPTVKEFRDTLLDELKIEPRYVYSVFFGQGTLLTLKKAFWAILD